MTKHRRVREGAAIAALVVAAIATLATSPAPPPTIQGQVQSGELRLEANSTLAVQRFVVSVNDLAGPGLDLGDSGISVERTDNEPGIRVTVAAVRQPRASGPTPSPDLYASSSTPDALQLAPRSTVGLPLDCVDAPCEEAFKVIAERTSGSGPAAVSWTVQPTLLYRSGNWPSGANVSVRVEPAAALDTASRSLTASIPRRSVTLSGTRPAFGTVVELRLAAAAIPAGAEDVATTAVFDSDAGFSIEGDSLSPDRSLSPFEPTQWDPFADCRPGTDCVRTYVVWGSTRLSGRESAVSSSWHLDVHQLWLTGSVPPAGSLTARIVREYSTTATPAQHLHAEGDVVLQAGQSYVTGDAAVRYSVSRPGAQFPLAAGLPIPAIATVDVALPSGFELAGGEALSADVLTQYRENTYLAGQYFYPLRPGAPVHAQGLAFVQRPGDPESDEATIRVELSRSVAEGTIVMPVTAHWSVDVDVYAYEGLGGPTLLQVAP